MSRVDSPRRKIAFMLTPIDFGGAERVSLNLLKSIDRDVFELCPIILVRPWENRNIFIDEIKKENYQYLQIPVAIKPLSEGKDYFRVIRCFRILFSILRKQGYDLVHTNGYFADIIGIPVSRLLGIPHIATCHGFISNDRNVIVYNILDRFALRFSNRIIAVSNSIRYDLIRNGIKESRTIVIQNAIEPKFSDNSLENKRQELRAILRIQPGEFVVGYVGRLSAEKGLKHLIEATSMSKGDGLPIRLLIIGDGPQTNELKSLVNRKGAQNNVTFAGFQSDIEKWMPALDIFVLPSLTEGTPMALLEAMSFGIPAIASAVGGIPQVIDSGENGILVQPGNREEIKNAVHILYTDESLRNRISQNAQRYIKSKHNIKDWTRKIEGEYLALLSDAH